MKNKRFISVDESGESIFTFDEADMIIDTKTNIVYGANNIPDLVKILNTQYSQWQRLKEWLEKVNHPKIVDEFTSGIDCAIKRVLDKMRELSEEE